MTKSDEGSSTIVGAFVAVAIVVIAALVMSVGAAVAARHRAQSAADFAALAGAYALRSGDEGCSAATRSASGAGAVVDECVVDGWDVQVRVHVSVSLSHLGARDAEASARAGPGEERDGSTTS